MKLLDCTLIGLLAGLGTPAWAQDATDAGAGVHCDASGCADGDGVVLRIRSRGEADAKAGDDGQLQSDRRVDVEQAPAGRTEVRGRFAVDLPGGGLLWATEDPQLAQPNLNVQASPLVPFEGGRITQPVRFMSYSNYPAFAEKHQLVIFRGTDLDRVSPLATIDLPATAVGEFTWDGELPAQPALREGDELQYVLRAIAADGSTDETFPNRLTLVRPDDVLRAQQALGRDADPRLGSLDAAQVEQRRLAEAVVGQGNLRQQNIPIYGSRVRIVGQDIPEGQSLKIDGRAYPVDLDRKFAAEFLLPVGKHAFEIEVGDRDAAVRRTLDVDVSGRYLFVVALADVTVSGNSVSGAVVPVGVDDRYDDVITEGRLAMYLKGKVQGKYLVTAQADTRENEVGELFDGFLDPDARDVFRRLDPDQYYPVYGDDSTTYRDVDTQGRLYVRVDWDKSQALWGNFETGLAGTEYGQYVRSLYGGAIAWRSRASTDLGEARHTLRAFGSEAQSAPGHSEFLGTGGSLYYLRHTDVLPGSDNVVLEVRDPLTGRVETRVDLVRDVDYEIDELQGRLLLTRPLLQIVRDNLPTIIRDAPLDGFENRLLVDYEYIPAGFSADQATAGVSGKTWLGEHVAVGGTYVDEQRSGEDYRLAAVDVTLQAGRGTYLKVEQARTQATSAPVFYSDNGGLGFTQLNPVAGSREGDARSVEARVNLLERGLTTREWTLGAWWRDLDAGFSVARQDIGLPIQEQGAEFAGQVSDDLRLSGRYSDARRGADGVEQAQVMAEWRLSDASQLTGELRGVTETRSGLAATGSLAALRYSQRVGQSLDLYGTGQVTLDDDGGSYAGNDAVTVGGRYSFENLSTLGAEVTSGQRGDSASVNGEYRLSERHALYGSYTYATDSTSGDPLYGGTPTGLTVGQRWRLSDQVNLYNESQFLKARQESGIAHTYGMDFYPGLGWTLGFTLQEGELESALGQVDRQAVSVSAGRTDPSVTWNSKLEYREDRGVEQRTQWVSTNRLGWRVNEDWRIAARFNYGDTEDAIDPLANARFVEGNVGFAYRPAANDRLALLGKFSYLQDLSSLGQDTLADYDQRTRILSLEGIYRLTRSWEVAGKLAHREGEARLARNAGPWFDTTADFAAAQARYNLHRQWDALAEYRWLRVDENDSERKGWLVGVDRHLGDNFRLGVGYNFTSFSDNLTVLDYDQKGWFLNVTGTY
ncbi:MAG TPA: hypothetical protein VFQ84_05785 [Arenimonas sp.]|uniref:hypothetical protein n=1 Tax=Arenimonas sp. TaxID=1872635 RepID=UPI002D7E7866|nr:hypothetical protein [Arenimonas sp.]HEU0152841.1 hypothetical protein [Arenimonas sp.]